MKLSILTNMLFLSGTLERFAGCRIYIAIFTTAIAVIAFYCFKKMK